MIMTTQDFNKLNQSSRQNLNSIYSELTSIKKDKLQLSARIKIERALAKIESLRVTLDTTFQ